MKKLLIISLLAIAIQAKAQNVGIGTSTPAFAYKLHVHGGEGSSDASFGLTNGTTTDANNRGARFRMNSSDLLISNNEATGKLSLATAFNQRLTIMSNGKVGIGILSPSSAALLEVDGQVKINGGSPGAGKILVTDLNGLATWQNSTKYTSIVPPGCQFLANATDVFAKIVDLGTFTKDDLDTKIELMFQTHLKYLAVSGAFGVQYELRIDNLATTNGNARASAQIVGQPINTSIFGLFTGLSTGIHTVSIWTKASSIGGTATNVFYDSGCWDSTNLTVKETF